MHESGGLEQAEAFKHSLDNFLELLATIPLHDLAYLHILLNLVDPFALEELASSLEEYFAQRLSTELEYEPQVILIINHVYHLAERSKTWVAD